jgi:L-alanine-DL-glutamate epimerase-like enolase superfamily enzyme
MRWDSTTMVLVELTSDSGERGLGFSYTAAAAATLVQEMLSEVVLAGEAETAGALWTAMIARVRNCGRPGIAATAISAVDTALWDLRARALGQPLFRLLGAYREEVPVYGSGGFTSYSQRELIEQLSGWVELGITSVKMKVGKEWGTRLDEDVERVRAVRHAVGDAARLFVDANGAYSVKQAIWQAARFADYGVTYFEEPVSSDHLGQLAFVRQHVPAQVQVAAGEYGYDPWYFRRMLESGAVDILQADATRCLGITGFMQAATLAYAFSVPFSAHTAPSIHAHAGCAAPQLEHVEYFHDHVRIERMLFDGVLQPHNGALRPDGGRPGLGLEFRRKDAEKWRIT